MTRRWIFMLGLAVVAMLQGTHAAACGQTVAAADSAGIRQAALDYIEGWYAGDAERMARAVHPELAKRIVRTDPQSGQSRLGQQSAMTLVEGTRRGGGRETPPVRQQKDVTILDLYQNAASVRIVASDWIDYLHLAKWNGRWVIVNVLWELKPQPPTASAAPPGGGRAAGEVVLRGAHAAQVEGVAFSPDGRWLASADNGGRVVLWSTRGWRQAAVLRGRNFTEVAFTPDSRRLAAAGFDSLVRVWSVPAGRLLHSLPYPGRAEALAVSPDGRLLAAAGGGERSVRVWEMASGREMRVLRGHTDDVYALRYSPDGRVLASAGRDRTVRLWDAATGAPLRTIGGSGDSVYGLAWSADGAWLAGAGRDGTVALWNARTGERAATLRGHTNSVHGAAFSPDGRVLATAGFDDTVRLWSIPDGAPLRTLAGHRQKVSDVAFNPAGTLLASAASDTTVRIWPVAP